MSPGLTFERIYAELKRQLREGVHPPGAPLEPALIGGALNASITPVRDALHRLVGERLVEAPRHNGFTAPRLSEMALRDLYAWNGELLGLAASRMRRPIDAAPAGSAGIADATAALFLRIAEATDSREHAGAVAQLNDRLAPFRQKEAPFFPDAEEECSVLAALAASESRAPLTRALARYHKRRIAAGASLLAAMLD